MMEYLREFLYGLFEIFFFQAKDGIRDFHVTGVQTCALPIFCDNQYNEYNEYDATRRFSRFRTGRHGGARSGRARAGRWRGGRRRSEEHTSELQSRENLVCRLLLEKKNKKTDVVTHARRAEVQ